MKCCSPARHHRHGPTRCYSLSDALFGDRPHPAETSTSTWTPPVDIVESEGHFEILVELPGVNGNEVKVVVCEGVLTLSGERPVVSSDEENRTHLTERRAGPFQRRFALPKNVDGEKVRAAFKNGVLTITVPKREDLKPREVEIKVA